MLLRMDGEYGPYMYLGTFSLHCFNKQTVVLMIHGRQIPVGQYLPNILKGGPSDLGTKILQKY